jgi:hypothetical protein
MGGRDCPYVACEIVKVSPVAFRATSWTIDRGLFAIDIKMALYPAGDLLFRELAEAKFVYVGGRLLYLCDPGLLVHA